MEGKGILWDGKSVRGAEVLGTRGGETKGDGLKEE